MATHQLQGHAVAAALLEHLQQAQEDEDLLRAVYREIGPYRDGQLSDGTLDRLRTRFGFDDSE